jgi:hypothetical protein
MRPTAKTTPSGFRPAETRAVPAQMFHFRHTRDTHPRARGGYGVCRGPGGPLGAVWGAAA